MTIDHPLAVAVLDANEAHHRARMIRDAAEDVIQDDYSSGAIGAFTAAEAAEDDAFMAREAAIVAWSAAGYPRSLLACAREVALDALLRDAPT